MSSSIPFGLSLQPFSLHFSRALQLLALILALYNSSSAKTTSLGQALPQTLEECGSACKACECEDRPLKESCNVRYLESYFAQEQFRELMGDHNRCEVGVSNYWQKNNLNWRCAVDCSMRCYCQDCPDTVCCKEGRELRGDGMNSGNGILVCWVTDCIDLEDLTRIYL